ncbi:electron transport complex protein RnfB [Novimethylophilus kurashikiensis]|uniref:Ion-translocating oxidoreductase complex subunit B n=1 Tax=Novimethylophilus kurashikiensis TaxID=1825523 RepID=A0A2R5F3X7_9PROT|nr:(Fe-S)-binding protein [Novimethylophilus kurashikiensis]GBG13142.1 electron transport complex protein RnfB [Novimethylophilus kurashikiensis]
MATILIAGTFMAVLGIALAALLAFASRRLYVYENPQIGEVEEMLPHSNCGACGTAGCRNFAEKVVEGELNPAKCTVNAPDQNLAIAKFLGMELADEEKRIARLACAGGKHVATMRAHYEGLSSCRAAAVAGGGGKACAWGCLGLADCADVCEFDAIHMNEFGLPVVDAAKCTACNDCVDICPKGLFSIQPVSHHLWVACKSLAEGDIAENYCEVACTACGRCVADAEPGLISLVNNLAVIDYEKNDLSTRKPIERCPTGAIVWVDDMRGALKGAAAKKIVRREALPIATEHI